MLRRGLSLVLAVSVLVAVGVAVDFDSDGPGTTSELRIGTTVSVADTGGDRLTAATEIEGGADALVADTDGDGLTDGREVELGADTSTTDTDGDGLVDDRELEIGTDPLDPDTDGDGLPDGPEVDRNDVLPDADPLRLDVFVEVDTVGGADLPEDEVERVVEAFDDAPIGPNGSHGVHLHVIFDETDLEDDGPVSVADREDRDGSSVRAESYSETHHDYRGYGYHYLLVVPEVLDVPGYEVLGEADDGVMLVQSVDREDVGGSTFMHELAHSIGLERDDFDGIDSREYSSEEYPSVMNYNSPPDYYGYSSGEPFDDWSAIEAGLHVPDTGRFNASAGG